MGQIRQWLGQVICFLCMMTLLLHVIPDTGLKKYVRFFLGLLFILVVLEPVGSLMGKGEFLRNLEMENIRGLYQEFQSGQMGLTDTFGNWDEEKYQKELEEKIREIYDRYHIPWQESHNNSRKAGMKDGQMETGRPMEEDQKGSAADRGTDWGAASGDCSSIRSGEEGDGGRNGDGTGNSFALAGE